MTLSRLRPRDDGAHQLGRGRLRAAQRRADVPDAGRERRHAAARGDAGAAGRVEDERSPACPTRPTARRTTTAPPDYDTLVDSPIVAGNPAIHRFDVGGKPHLLVDVGEGGRVRRRPRRRATSQKHRPAEPSASGASLPYERYVFFNLLASAAAAWSTRTRSMLMASRWATGTRRGLRRLADARRRTSTSTPGTSSGCGPIELGPFDYERENYTRSLWISEGFTAYYGDLLVRARRRS